VLRFAFVMMACHLLALPADTAASQLIGAGESTDAAGRWWASPYGFAHAFPQAATDADGPLAPVLPTLWWNDLSDVTVGVWARLNYEKTHNRLTVAVQRGFGGVEDATLGESLDFYAEIENPSILPFANVQESIAGWAREGTVGARVRVEFDRPGARSGTGLRRLGGDLQWIATREVRFLDRNLWDNAGSVEATAHLAWALQPGRIRATVRTSLGGGIVYRRGETNASAYDGNPFVRAYGDVVLQSSLAGFELLARGYAGAYLGDERPIQRAIPVNGADPYETLANPLVRTAGAPLVGRDVFYHSPGHANVRGFRPGLAGRWALAANLEVVRPIVSWTGGVLRSVSVVAFFDAAVVDTLAIQTFQGRAYKPVSDGGGGVRLQFQVWNLRFPLRVEFPIYVSDPVWAHDSEQGLDYVEFRWLVSLQPIF